MIMKKVNVEIEIPEGYEFVGFSDTLKSGDYFLNSNDGLAVKVEAARLSYRYAQFIVLKPEKKKQIIFTSTGKKRIPCHGDYICNSDGDMILVGNRSDREFEIFAREEKWV